MGIENTRLLIVVKQADYRQQLADIFDPQTLIEKLSERMSAIDINILRAATQWSEQVQEVAIFSSQSDTLYSEQTYLGIQLMGGKLNSGFFSTTQQTVALSERQATIRLIADFCPTHIVMCALSDDLLAWAIHHKIPTLALLSEWQEPLGKKQFKEHLQRVRQLNHAAISWVGTQGVYACKVLENSGISPSKLIPWRWDQPQIISPYGPKHIQADPTTGQTPHIQLLYIDPVIARPDLSSDLNPDLNSNFSPEISLHRRAQGSPQIDTELDQMASDISHLLSAVHYLHSNGFSVSLRLICGAAGPALTPFYEQAQKLAIHHLIHFGPPPPAEQLLAQVHAADLVVIPGDSSTLLAQPSELPAHLSLALAARTPIVAADHPAFEQHLSHGVNAMIFPAGNAKSMAHRIARIMGQPQLYHQLSAAAELSLSSLKVPAQWTEIIDRWLRADRYLPSQAEHAQWLCDCAFSSGRYQLLPNTGDRT